MQAVCGLPDVTSFSQIQGVSVEYEGLKKSLSASETAKEIDETEKRLKVRTERCAGLIPSHE
jgi:hypothetical protein